MRPAAKPAEGLDHAPIQNVLLFGESGVGKSSIVNLILGSPPLAKISSDANACTTRTAYYQVTIKGRAFKIWDTAGLDGGSYGRFRAVKAERGLKKSIQTLLKKDGLSLLIYCARASRATRALVHHYRSVSEFSQNSVPMVIVVTGLENSVTDMEKWWEKNGDSLLEYGMKFKDHACITSIEDDPNDSAVAQAHRAVSRSLVQDLIFRNSISRERDREIFADKQSYLSWPRKFIMYFTPCRPHS